MGEALAGVAAERREMIKQLMRLEAQLEEALQRCKQAMLQTSTSTRGKIKGVETLHMNRTLGQRDPLLGVWPTILPSKEDVRQDVMHNTPATDYIPKITPKPVVTALDTVLIKSSDTVSSMGGTSSLLPPPFPSYSLGGGGSSSSGGGGGAFSVVMREASSSILRDGQ
ncbi:hypothetical protein LSM04_008133 [Trypanosoma melophagium]|uniref:uncharacterized protein n=1 Tax=Trypanosoma melophagium TaxID=715481 RepID=UPI003519ED62|nr:hypothetical protein LSM04_008133 [Trypanosoma melophagium]